MKKVRYRCRDVIEDSVTNFNNAMLRVRRPYLNKIQFLKRATDTAKIIIFLVPKENAFFPPFCMRNVCNRKWRSVRFETNFTAIEPNVTLNSSIFDYYSRGELNIIFLMENAHRCKYHKMKYSNNGHSEKVALCSEKKEEEEETFKSVNGSMTERTHSKVFKKIRTNSIRNASINFHDTLDI